MLIYITGYSQSVGVDTRELDELIKKWNFANNEKSVETFLAVYDDRVIFYTEKLSKLKCVALKQKFFRKHPDTEQRIISTIKYTPYTNGIIRAGFTKEVFLEKKWRIFPSYLLISYENNRYVISGESDSLTDRKLKYTPDLGSPMELPAMKYAKDSTNVTKSSPDTLHETIKAKGDSVATAFKKEVLSEEAVIVPKKYIYYLVGFLLLIGIIVQFQPVRPRYVVHEPLPAKKAPVVNNVLHQDKAFEHFVTSLFDPHYFKLTSFHATKVYAGNIQPTEFQPVLEADFKNKDLEARFVVECLYLQKITSRILTEFTPNQIKNYRSFESETGIEAYLIIGLEGEASNPKEIYLIRSNDLRPGPLTYPDVKPYRKYGMFFYSAAKRLQ